MSNWEDYGVGFDNQIWLVIGINYDCQSPLRDHMDQRQSHKITPNKS